MIYLKQSTASQSVIIGPFVDSTDGVTAETALTISNTDIRLSKNGANIVGKNSGGGTHDENGYYTITLDATDTDTVGRLQLHVNATGALAVYHEFQVLEEAIYDALFGSGADGFDANGRVDVGAVLGTAQTAGNLTALITTVDTVVDGIQTDLDNGTDGLGAIKTAVDAIPTSNPSAATIADAVWDEARAGHTTPGTYGQHTGDAAMRGTDSAYTGTPPTVAAIRAEIDSNSTQLAAIVADTNELQTDWADGGRLDLILDARASQTSLDTVDSNVDAILVDTGTTLDANITAIKVKTDSLTFTQAGNVDANIQYVNDVQVSGTGTDADPWNPA